MSNSGLNNIKEWGWSCKIMGRKNIMKEDVVPKEVSEHVVAQQITPDYILELYEKSKKLRGKKKQALLDVAERLSKNVGKWLVDK